MMENKKPVFVKLESYQEILSLLNTMKTKIEVAKGTIEDIKKIKRDEEAEIEMWENSLNQVEDKINFIDSVLVECENI